MAGEWPPALLALIATMVAVPAVSQPIDYDPRRAAELRPCDEHRYRGRTEQARSCYSQLIRSPNLVTQAEAAWALGDLQTANELFKQAVQANERSAQPRLRWGRLFDETHQYAYAVAVFREAL